MHLSVYGMVCYTINFFQQCFMQLRISQMQDGVVVMIIVYYIAGKSYSPNGDETTLYKNT